MTSFTWTGTAGGDWNNGADWNPNVVPNATTADATLGVTGTYTVTISSGDPTYTVESLTLDNPGATFVDAGTLALAGAQALLALDAGTFDLTGTVQGGTIDQAGGSLIVGSGATLDGVTLLGPLAIGVADAVVNLAGGLTVETAVGGLPGTIDITGEYADLNVLDSETLSNVSIALGGMFPSGFGYNEYNYASLDIVGQTLTLGSDATLYGVDGDIGGYTFVNEGTISVTFSLGFYNEDFVNAGLLSVAANAYLYLGASFSNTGTLALSGELEVDSNTHVTLPQLGTIIGGSGSSLYVYGTLDLNGGTLTLGGSGIAHLYVYGTIENGTLVPGAGAFYVESTGTFDGVTVNYGPPSYTGSLDLAQLQTLAAGNTGLIDITGTLNLSGGTLDIAASGSLSDIELAGFVENGTLVEQGGSLTFASGVTLDAVTVLGSLDVSGSSYSDLIVEGGLTVETASGTPPGTIYLTGLDGAALDVLDSETLDNVSINIDGLYSDINVGFGSTATLGGHAVLTAGDLYLLSGTLVNDGDVISTYFYAEGADFINAGTLSSTDIYVEAPFTNTGTIALNGFLALYEYQTLQQLGTIVGGSGSELEVYGTLNLNGGTLTLGGTGIGSLYVYGTVENGTVLAGGGGIHIESYGTLDNVTVNYGPPSYTGSLDLAQLQTLAAGNTGLIDITGTLNLSGGTLDIAATGSLSDVELAGVVMNGTLVEQGGSLTFASGVTLDAVTLLGSLDVSGFVNQLSIEGGLTVETQSGAVPGTVDVAGSGGADIYVLDSETLDNVSIILGTTGDGYDYLNIGYGQTLTLGSNTALTTRGFGDYVQGGTLVNDGDIASASFLFLEGAEFVNAGTLSTTLDAINIETTFDNTGLLSIGASADVYAEGSFTNSGTVALNGGLLLYDYTTLQQLGTVVGGASSSLTIYGTLDLKGGTLDLGASGIDALYVYGTVENGTLIEGAGALRVESNGTLANIEYTAGPPSPSGSIDLAQLETLEVGNTGLVDITGTLNLSGGTLAVLATGSLSELEFAGVVENGTLEPEGGVLVVAPGATVDGITYLGTLNLNVTGASIDVLGGLTVETASGGTPGTINITGSDVGISFLDSETLDHVTVNIKAQSAGTGVLQEATGDTLTLGPNALLNAATGLTLSGGTVVNEGTVLATGGTFFNEASSFVNTGTVVLDGTVTMDVSAATIDNSGIVSVGAGDVLDLEDPSSFVNTGTISIAAGGTLVVGGNVTLAQLAGIDVASGGVIDDIATLDLQGGTLDVGATGSLSDVAFGGVIEKGTIAGQGGSVTVESGVTLDAVTVLGNLSIGAVEGGLNVRGGLTVETAAGALPGTIDLAGENAFLDVLDSETLNNVSIVVGNPGTTNIYYDTYIDVGYGLTLTLGSNSAVSASGSALTFDSGTIVSSGVITGTDTYVYVQTYADFINAGTIASTGGEGLIIYGTFDNAGLLSIGAGAYVDIDAPFTNTGTIAADGNVDVQDYVTLQQLGTIVGGPTSDLIVFGTLDLNGGTLTLGGAAIDALYVYGTVENGTLIEGGGGYHLESEGTLENVTINYGPPSYTGSLDLTQLQTLAAGNTGLIDITGTLNLSGGTLDISSTGSLSDIELAGFVENGTIVEQGGSLTFGDGVTLDAVTLLGSLVASGAGYSIDVEGGLAVETASGAVPGTIDITGYESKLDVLDSETLDDVSIVLGYAQFLDAGNLEIGGPTLTLGSGASIVQADGEIEGGTLVNDGSIGVTEYLIADSANFINAGLLSIAAGSYLDLDSAFSNSGTIAANGDIEVGYYNEVTLQQLGVIVGGSASELIVDGTLNLNGGTLTLGDGGINAVYVYGTVENGTLIAGGGGLHLENEGTLDNATIGYGPPSYTGSLDLAQLQTLAAGNTGLIDITGTLNLSGGTLDVAATGSLSDIELAGVVENGTIAEQGGSLTFGSGVTLDAVTVLGLLDTSGGISIQGGFAVESSTGGTPGVIELAGYDSTLDVLDSETLNNVSIIYGSSNSEDYGLASISVGNAQTLTLGSAVTVTNPQDTAYFEGGTVVNEGDIIDSDSMQIEGADFINAGTLSLTGGDDNALYLDGSFDNAGLLSIGAGTFVAIDAPFSNSGTIAVDGVLNIFPGASITLQQLGTIIGGSSSAIAVNGTLDLNGGTLTLGSNGFSELDTYGTVENGTLVDGADDAVVGEGVISSLIALSGLIAADYGLLTLSQTVQAPANVYTGVLQIDAGATLELGDGSGPGIHFNGAGATLQLDAPAANTGTFTGLAAGDTLVLQGVTATDAHSAGNLLTIDLAGGTSLEYSLAAPLTGLVETTGTTAAGSEVSFLIPCFLRGTLIATTTGDIAVENLRVGDHVITAAGTARPIRWLGHRAVDCTNIPDPQAAWPVLVRQGAFGEAMPVRDLWLSPEHCIATQDALIPARVLQNGRTIVQVARAAVEYWHVELDSHDVILAEGLPVETFLDNGNRYAFEGGADYAARYPDRAPKHWTETCRPLLLEGAAVAAAKSHLLRRAAALGHAITGDADLHMLADGQRLAPLWLSESRAAFVLGAGCREIALQSRCFVPAHLDGATADWRSLGVCVARLQIDGSEIDLADDAAFQAGWHRLEDDGAGYRQRWTSGGARLPAQARLVVLDIAGPGFYWIDEPLAVVPAATGPWAWVTTCR